MRYEELCGKATPFATLCHDVWNGVNKDVLGLSLMFADLRNGNVYHIPLGLIMAQGHSARQVCDLSVAFYPVLVSKQTDLFGTVNDNTNSTALAGKYILNHQGEGKCDMHITDLILKHATGLVICTKNHGCNRILSKVQKSFLSCTHVNSCQNHILYINLHILLNI